MFLIICFLVVMVVLIIYWLMSYKSEWGDETDSPYECGFEPVGKSRIPFSYRFFLISILFLIFDVEISLMLPIPYLCGSVGSSAEFVLFMGVLVMGVLYEYKYGSLDWLWMVMWSC